ncbi:MAG: right-handed parallel beta-helix repeat-containing protein [Muribaculaceae bacterium]|nr:right-handed parallel beta-helix repeat-containing protein [Muribaculaceae bacterium]
MNSKAILLGAAMALSAIGTQAKDYVLTDYEVSTDSTIVQTAAIQAVIDRAEAEGGGTIVVPKGTFLSGALFFKPGTKLHLAEGAEIKGSDDIANFPLIPSRMEGRSIYYYAALINAYHVDNFEITGSGVINGNGLKYWQQFWDLRAERKKEGRSCTNLEVHRPRLVFLWGCDKLKLSGVSLRNSPFWTTHLYQCKDVIIENCRIEAPREPVRAPSSDAIDLDMCSDVIIRGCYLNCDDDGVCIKGGKGVYANRSMESGIVENVLVEDCVFGPNLHGVLTMGSECVHAKNILLQNCRLEAKCALLRLKMRPDTYQTYENITVKNVTGKCATVIDMKPWKQFFDLENSGEEPSAVVRNILMENIDVECRTFGTIAGNPADKVSNFVLRDIKAQAEDPTFTCVYPEVVLENVSLNGKKLTNPAK